MKKKFENINIPLLKWAFYFPDINSIEYMWKKLKELIFKNHSELLNIEASAADLKALCAAIIEAWDSIEQSWIDNLIDSMPRRLEALIKAKGWHTKY